MKTRIAKKTKKLETLIAINVKQVMETYFASVLHDISYRIGVLVDTASGNRITSGMLNLAQHLVDGYVMTNNSPIAGSVAFTDLNIVYKGTTYAITNGNTALKYLYWTLATTPNTLKFSATKPTLGVDDILIAINEGGIATMSIGGMIPGGAIIDGTVNSAEIATNAIVAAKILDGAIIDTKIGTGAVTNVKLGALAVDGAKLAAGAVTAGKIGALAVASGDIAAGAIIAGKIGALAIASGDIAAGAVIAGKLATDAVASGNIAANAVIAGKINTDAVTSGTIAAGAVIAGKLATDAVASGNIAANAVIAGKLATDAVTTATIAANAVTAVKIGAGQVAADKLNVATHFIF